VSLESNILQGREGGEDTLCNNALARNISFAADEHGGEYEDRLSTTLEADTPCGGMYDFRISYNGQKGLGGILEKAG
jgi:hypothetical protein